MFLLEGEEIREGEKVEAEEEDWGAEEFNIRERIKWQNITQRGALSAGALGSSGI